MADAPREVRLFVAAFEERSFTAAATRENATQSGVSQHIRKLEDRFGAQLFVRTGSAVVPTPAAEAYYRTCLEILRAHDTAAATLRRFGKGLEGEVAVGLMPTMTRCALAPALARFLDLHPNVAIHVTEAYSHALTEQVQAGTLDFAVVPAFPGGPGLRQTPFARTPEVLVAASSCGRRPGAPVRLAELGPLKLVAPGRQNTRRQTIETYCASAGVRIARLLELDAMFGTLDLVARTDWVTVLPGVMMAGGTGDFRVGPLTGPPLALDLSLIEPARREMAPAAGAFLDVLREETVRLAASFGAAA